MTQHPIQGLMRTAMDNLKNMVDVNTILGKPVSTQNGSVILTVSKVSFGFGAGGSDFGSARIKPAVAEENAQRYPFGGGSGAGVSISPVAFLTVGSNGVQVMHLHSGTHLVEKAIDAAPKAIQSVQNMMSSSASNTPSGDPMTNESMMTNKDLATNNTADLNL